MSKSERPEGSIAVSADCYGAPFGGISPLSKAAKALVVVYPNGGREVSCQYLTAGSCRAAERQPAFMGQPACFYLFPENRRLPNSVIIQRALNSGLVSRLGQVQFTQSEINAVNLMAQGETNEQIGLELGYKRQTVKNHNQELYERLNVSSRLEAVLLGVDSGVVDLFKALKGVDVANVQNFDPIHRQIMNLMVEDCGKRGSNEQIATSLRLSYRTIKNYLTEIYQLLEVNSREQAAVGYLVGRSANLTEFPFRIVRI